MKMKKEETFGGYKLHTRRGIIRIWEKQNPDSLDSYCCPNCRDILYRDEKGNLYCENSLCLLSRPHLPKIRGKENGI